jgi:hypothetical protein
VISGSSIGIGTGTPSTKLQVVGGVTATSFTGSFSGSITAPGSTTQVAFNSGGALSADSGFVYSGSNVGIGTTTPAGKLHVSGTILLENNFALQSKDASGTARRLAQYTSGNVVIFGSDISHVIQLASNGATILRDNGTDLDIDPSTAGGDIILLTNQTGGSVGIGTSSPGAKLQITGGTLDGASLTDLGISSGLTTGRLGTFDASSLASISTRGDASSVELAAGSSATYYTGISATANNATSFTGTLRFFTSGSEKVRITPSGNVGIGTTTPNFPLHIGDGSSSEQIMIQSNGGGATVRFYDSVNDSGGNRYQMIGHLDTTQKLQFSATSSGLIAMSIVPDGRVGIGTTNPSNKLEVNGGVTATSFTGSFSGSITAPGSTTQVAFNSGGALSADSGFVYSGSKVGIGLATPGAKLDIVSTGAGSEGLRVDGSGGGFAFVVKAGSDYTSHIRAGATVGVNYFTTPPSNGLIVEGNVGIGTTSPGGILTISGSSNQLVIGNSWSGNQDIVFAGGSSDNTGGNNNTAARIRSTAAAPGGAAVGDLRFTVNSGDSLTDAIYISGSGNVGIGTTSPQQRLMVASPSDTSVVLGASYLSTNNNNFFEVGINANDGYLNLRNSGVSTTVHIDSDGNSYLNGGNVGIGTSSPSNKLYVSDTVEDYVAVIENLGTGTAKKGLWIKTDSSFTNATVLKVTGTTSDSETLQVNPGQVRIGPGSIGQFDGTLFLTSSAATVANFVANNSSALFISGSGNVGIGATSPTNKLEVLGGATIRNSSGGGALNIGTNSGRTEYQYVTLGGGIGGTDYGWQVGRSPQTGGIINDGFYIYDIKTNNAPFAIALGGSVGIGTANPSTKLHVSGANATNIAYLEAPRAGFKFYTNSTSTYTTTFGMDDTGLNIGHDSSLRSINLRTNNQDRLTVLGNGNVGIGTTSPNRALMVSGSIGAFVANDQGAVSITVGEGSSITGNIISLETNSTTNTTRLYNNGTSTDFNIGSTGTGGNVALSSQQHLFFKVNNGGDVFSGTTAMYVSSSGNVGIGTTAPSAGTRLQVQGNIFSNNVSGNAFSINSAGSNYGFILNNSANTFSLGYGTSLGTLGTSVLTWNSSGNVGIGTTSPSYRLHVSGAIAIEAESTTTKYSTTFSGSLTTNTNIAFIPTGSFKAAFFDYYVASGSVNMRAGTVMAVHNNSTSATQTPVPEILETPQR